MLLKIKNIALWLLYINFTYLGVIQGFIQKEETKYLIKYSEINIKQEFKTWAIYDKINANYLGGVFSYKEIPGISDHENIITFSKKESQKEFERLEQLYLNQLGECQN